MRFPEVLPAIFTDRSHFVFGNTRLLLGIFLSWGVLGCHRPPAPQWIGTAGPYDYSLRKSVDNLLQRQVDAWNAGDIDGFMAGYWKSDDLTFSSGGTTRKGWSATRDYYKRKYATREQMGVLKFERVRIMRLESNNNCALALGEWMLLRNGDSVGGNFSLVMVFIPGQGLRIVHDHSSLLNDSPAPQPAAP